MPGEAGLDGGAMPGKAGLDGGAMPTGETGLDGGAMPTGETGLDGRRAIPTGEAGLDGGATTPTGERALGTATTLSPSPRGAGDGHFARTWASLPPLSPGDFGTTGSDEAGGGGSAPSSAACECDTPSATVVHRPPVHSNEGTTDQRGYHRLPFHFNWAVPAAAVAPHGVGAVFLPPACSTALVRR